MVRRVPLILVASAMMLKLSRRLKRPRVHQLLLLPAYHVVLPSWLRKKRSSNSDGDARLLYLILILLMTI